MPGWSQIIDKATPPGRSNANNNGSDDMCSNLMRGDEPPIGIHPHSLAHNLPDELLTRIFSFALGPSHVVPVPVQPPSPPALQRWTLSLLSLSRHLTTLIAPIFYAHLRIPCLGSWGYIWRQLRDKPDITRWIKVVEVVDDPRMEERLLRFWMGRLGSVKEVARLGEAGGGQGQDYSLVIGPSDSMDQVDLLEHGISRLRPSCIHITCNHHPTVYRDALIPLMPTLRELFIMIQPMVNSLTCETFFALIDVLRSCPRIHLEAFELDIAYLPADLRGAPLNLMFPHFMAMKRSASLLCFLHILYVDQHLQSIGRLCVREVMDHWLVDQAGPRPGEIVEMLKDVSDMMEERVVVVDREQDGASIPWWQDIAEKRGFIEWVVQKVRTGAHIVPKSRRM